MKKSKKRCSACDSLSVISWVNSLRNSGSNLERAENLLLTTVLNKQLQIGLSGFKSEC